MQGSRVRGGQSGEIADPVEAVSGRAGVDTKYCRGAGDLAPELVMDLQGAQQDRCEVTVKLC